MKFVSGFFVENKRKQVDVVNVLVSGQAVRVREKLKPRTIFYTFYARYDLKLPQLLPNKSSLTLGSCPPVTSKITVRFHR